MNIYFEPINLNVWNIIEKYTGKGYVETLLATKQMAIGDMLLLHVGSQNKDYPSGIYGYGFVVDGPYYVSNQLDSYCNERYAVKVRIDCLANKPLITHKETSDFVKQFRATHKIDQKYYPMIFQRLNITPGVN